METETEIERIRAMGTTWQKWKYTTMIMGKDEIENLEPLDCKRQVRSSNVSKLRRLLEAGKHFETPFVCNKVGKKWRLLDGNHRFEALRQFFDKFPARRVQVAVCYYEDLDADEERNIFTIWNLGTKQTTNDFVKLHWDEIPITKLMKKPSFPWNVSPYPSPNTIEFKLLTAPYLVKDSQYDYRFHGSAHDFIEAAKLLGKDDLPVLKQFLQEYIELFGQPEKGNIMYRPCNFIATMRIWLNNRTQVTPDKMKKRLSKLRNCERSVYWSGQSNNTDSVRQCFKDFLEVVNKGNHKETFN